MPKLIAVMILTFLFIACANRGVEERVRCEKMCEAVANCAEQFDRAACDAYCRRTLVYDMPQVECLLKSAKTKKNCFKGLEAIKQPCGEDDVLTPRAPDAL